MLDIRTLLIVTFALTMALGVALLIVWRGQAIIPGSRLPGVPYWAFGCLLVGLGLLLLSLRGLISDWLSVVLANVIVIAGQGLMALSIADLLDWQKPRLRLVVYGTIILAALFWPLALLLVPQNIGLRVTVYAVIVMAQFIVMLWLLLRVDTLPRLQRWAFAIVVALHMAAVVLRGISGLFIPAGDAYFNRTLLNTIWALENIVSVVAFTVCFAVLLGARLTRDVERQNTALGEVIGTQRLLQMQLRTALNQEAAMRQEQQLFINRISADFDVPLRSIASRVERLRALPPPLRETVAPRLDAIAGASRRLRLLIDTFLLDRRIQGGIAEMRQELVDLKALLAELLQEQARPGARPGAEWRLQFRAPDAPVMARGDAAMLAVVFGNLVDNALKYSGPEAPVQVTLERIGDEAVVTVADQGIGIPERDIGAIGQRFFRAGNTAAVPGTGLGLFSAGRLIQFHGGRFTVDSKPGQGSSFKVLLPLGETLAGEVPGVS